MLIAKLFVNNSKLLILECNLQQQHCCRRRWQSSSHCNFLCNCNLLRLHQRMHV